MPNNPEFRFDLAELLSFAALGDEPLLGMPLFRAKTREWLLQVGLTPSRLTLDQLLILARACKMTEAEKDEQIASMVDAEMAIGLDEGTMPVA